jgi:alkanesulfonate monooxygenase SsuD/methylene tetrahydromethanopterin reductase-like flavin-dependent oxidoreductase (luciferase family)
MSSNRVDVSIGTGWNVGEHEALGLAFEPLRTRFDRLEEYIQVLLGLWSREPFTYEGRYYQVKDIAPRPLPAPRPPLIIGGHGRRKTPLLAARYADEYNVDWFSADECRHFYRLLDDACAEIGRDPATIRRSVLLGVMVGEDRSDVRRVVEAGVHELGGADPDGWLTENRSSWRAGTPDEIVSWLREYEAAGTDHVMLMYAPHTDVHMVDILATGVLPEFQGGSDR